MFSVSCSGLLVRHLLPIFVLMAVGVFEQLAQLLLRLASREINVVAFGEVNDDTAFNP